MIATPNCCNVGHHRHAALFVAMVFVRPSSQHRSKWAPRSRSKAPPSVQAALLTAPPGLSRQRDCCAPQSKGFAALTPQHPFRKAWAETDDLRWDTEEVITGSAAFARAVPICMQDVEQPHPAYLKTSAPRLEVGEPFPIDFA